MFKKRSALVTAVVGALLLAGCSPEGGASADTSDTGDSSTSKEALSLSIGVVPVADNAALYIADEDGIFEEHGLDVSFETIQGFSAAVPSMMNGQLDLAVAGLPPFIAAVDANMPLKSVVGLTADAEKPEDSPARMIVPPGSDIDRPSDLANKVIAVNQIGGGPHVGTLGAYLKDGGEPDAVEWVTMPFSDMIAAVEAGTVDGAAVSEPFTTAALKEGLEGAFASYTEPGAEIAVPGSPYVALTGTDTYLSENPEVVERLRAAMAEATEVANSDRERVNEYLTDVIGMEPEVASEMKLAQFVSDPLEGSHLQIWIDVMYDNGLIEQDLNGEDLILN